MKIDNRISDDQLQDGKSSNRTDQNTIYLPDEEIERIPDLDDDYRLPRSLPVLNALNETDDEEEEADDLTDGNSDISEEELKDLDDAASDLSSDETLSADLLDDTDEDGTELNEGPDEDNLFDMGEDLDMPPDVNNPDGDIEELEP